MSLLSQLLNQIAHADTFTWICVLLMSFIGSSLVFTQLGSWIMGALYFPGLVVGSMMARAAAQLAGYSWVADKKVNTIIFVGMGAIASLMTLMIVTRIFFAISALMTKAPQRDPSEMDQVMGRRNLTATRRLG